jgi:WD40 repeat protein
MAVIYTLDENNIPQCCESNISVSSDKQYFAIGSTKGTIYVFNTMNGKVNLKCFMKLLLF